MGSMDTQSILTGRMNRPIIGGSPLPAGPDRLAGDSRARGSHKPVFLSRVDRTEADSAELDGVLRAIYVTGGVSLIHPGFCAGSNDWSKYGGYETRYAAWADFAEVFAGAEGARGADGVRVA